MGKKVVIVGGGEVGQHLAGLLLAWGHHPTLVERRPEKVERLKYKGTAAIVEGDGTDPQILETAGIRGADIMAAVTGSDEINLTVASLSRFQFNVGRTLARVNVPRHAWMFTAALGVDVALNQAEVLAHLIVEQASTGDMLTLLKLGGGQYSLIEVQVGPASTAIGKTITSLALPLECVIVGVLRQGSMVIPRGPTELRGGDQIIAMTHQDHCQQIRLLLEGSGGNLTAKS